MRKATHIRNRAFAGVIPHQARSGSHGTNTGNVDDRTTSSLNQRRYNDSDAQVYALDIHGHDAIELVLGDFIGRLVAIASSCIVDEYIHAAELALRCRHHGFPVTQLGDVGRDRYKGATTCQPSEPSGGLPKGAALASDLRATLCSPPENAFARPSPFMSAATTFAPSARNFLTVAKPKPDAAPD